MKTNISPNKPIFTWPKILIALIVLLGLFAVGCVFDFQISDKLFHQASQTSIDVSYGVSNVLMTIGYASILVGLFSLIFASRKLYVQTDKKVYLGFFIVTIIGSCIFWIICALSYSHWNFVSDVEYAGLWINLAAMLLCTAAAFCVSFFWIRKMDAQLVFKLMFWFIIFVCVISLARLLICWLWSRPRPRWVFGKTDPKSFFKNVWELTPFATLDRSIEGHGMMQSFPSGHTALCASCIGLVATVYRLNNSKKKWLEYVIFFAALILPMITGLMRILSGWHFLTDVIFAIILNLLCFYACSFVNTHRLAKNKLL